MNAGQQSLQHLRTQAEQPRIESFTRRIRRQIHIFKLCIVLTHGYVLHVKIKQPAVAPGVRSSLQRRDQACCRRSLRWLTAEAARQWHGTQRKPCFAAV